MPGRAKPKLVESDAKSKRKYDLVKQGVELYAEEAKKPAHLRMGTQKIMEKVTAAHKQQTGETITFSHTTIYRRYHGGRSLYEFNKAKSWINHDERESIIDFLIQTAERGFPHTHRRLEESANSIIHNRLPAFPRVGVNWTARFLVLNLDRLSCYWGSPLDQCRARAVNPHTINAWFTLVGGLIEEHGVEWENIWGADETGVELGEAGKERVIGPSGKNNQKRTSSGNRQNVTVMATIGACGQSLPPFVIYKGQAFQVKWFQNNPTNATLSYSVKGYMTGEVSLDWIKHFDRHTSVQAQHGAKARLLLVDGHVSHYTLELLNYARDHNIILACYPSHTTHVLQGLDVACFGRLQLISFR